MSSPLRIMISDPDPRIGKSAARALSSKNGLEVIGQTRTSYETVGRAISLIPQVVLMEIRLESPQAGLLTLRQIHQSLPETGVIIYSEIHDSAVVCKAFEEGAINYLYKPAADAALIHAVIAAGKRIICINSDSASALLEDYRRVKTLERNLGNVVRIAMRLTDSELGILRLMAGGMKTAEIEKIRFIEHSTMKTHISHIIKKFGLENISQVLDQLEECSFFRFLDRP